MAKDPVCGIMVDEKTSNFKSLYRMNAYYFDTEKCKTEFDKNPQKYIKKTQEVHPASYPGGYCPTPECNKPQKGAAWYLYIALILLVAALILYSVLRASI